VAERPSYDILLDSAEGFVLGRGRLNDTVLQQSSTAAVTARAQQYVQIFHVNINHWLTASNFGTATHNVSV